MIGSSRAQARQRTLIWVREARQRTSEGRRTRRNRDERAQWERASSICCGAHMLPWILVDIDFRTETGEKTKGEGKKFRNGIMMSGAAANRRSSFPLSPFIPI